MDVRQGSLMHHMAVWVPDRGQGIDKYTFAVRGSVIHCSTVMVGGTWRHRGTCGNIHNETHQQKYTDTNRSERHTHTHTHTHARTIMHGTFDSKSTHNHCAYLPQTQGTVCTCFAIFQNPRANDRSRTLCTFWSWEHLWLHTDTHTHTHTHTHTDTHTHTHKSTTNDTAREIEQGWWMPSSVSRERARAHVGPYVTSGDM